MDPERWLRVKQMFEAAVEQDPARRAAFLDEACSGDPALRTEVEALLAGHEDEDGFLEKPAYQAAADLFEDEPVDSQVGSRIGPYRLMRKIGQGGMGIVYLAEDSRLERLVAIKALAPECTRNAQFRERLRREAKAAARLSDPGIATVFALEESGDDLYLVREYVRGRTLLEETEKNPLPLSTVLDIAVRLVRALVVAHENGVVHRDLKPENVVRTQEGGIKILDFGLARIVTSEPGAALSSMRLTRAGTLIGTPAYSSPEQLLGEEVDFRSDIFSFAVMIFELVSGIHPFAAADPISIIARILESEPPDLSTMGVPIDPDLDRILRRCLRKNPAERYSSTRELLAELDQVQRKYAGAQAPLLQPAISPPPSPRRSSLLWWWQFHQATVAIVYYLMLYPLWVLRTWTPGVWGSLIFFPPLVAVGVAANLRFHLWFTSAFYPSELAWYRRRVAPWIRCGDVVFVSWLFGTAIAIHKIHANIATLLLTAAIGSLVGFVLIEPTTTRAALQDRDKNSSPES